MPDYVEHGTQIQCEEKILVRKNVNILCMEDKMEIVFLLFPLRIIY